MRNAGALAEWILSLVTSRERAAATIGDLVEEEARPFAFWGSIAWTAFSLIWRDFSVAPLGCSVSPYTGSSSPSSSVRSRVSLRPC